MTAADLLLDVLAVLPTIAEQRTALGTVFENLPGIQTVFERPPRAVQSAELPAVLLFPGGETHTRSDYDTQLKITRSWEAWMFVGRSGSGREFDTEKDVEPFLDALPILLSVYKKVLLPDRRFFWLMPTGNSGPKFFDYNDQLYGGLTQMFQTTVEIDVKRVN